jgi:hypothetical protein
MLNPKAVEWDEYFGMCALQERMSGKTSPEAEYKMAKSRLSKLRQCREGRVNTPVAESQKVEDYLRANQLSTLVEISHSTGIGHDTLKEILYQGRKDLFFMFRTDALGDSGVYYSVLETDTCPASARCPKRPSSIKCRSYVVRWMGYRGFIDPKFFHLPMNMKEEALIYVLRDLKYREEEVGVSQDKRIVFFESVS